MTEPRASSDRGFEAELFKAADRLRCNLEPSEYKHVVLGLVFLKCISEAFELHHAKFTEDEYAVAEDPEEYLAENIFWVPPVARWSHLRDRARDPNIGNIIVIRRTLGRILGGTQ
jgi:type I restriction enzyme M protein